MLQRLLAVGLCSGLIIGAGSAAELLTVPLESSGISVPVAGDGFDWNGFYAGVYGVTQSRPDGEAGVGLGIEAGVNAQIDFFLVGGEVALHGLTSDTIDTAYGQITGRGGVLVTDDLLAFVSAGVGVELTAAGESSALAGGGLEFAVTEGVSVSAEYLHGFAFEGDTPTDQFSLGAKFHF
ncbi:MAG: outer membrane protein [Devosia sp.]